MILICKLNYSYGSMPRIPAKQAKDLDLDPKAYHGGPVQVFEAGKEYDVETGLALRLLRDHGPKRGRGVDAVRFEPKDMRDMVELLAPDAAKITLAEVLNRGFVTAEDAAPAQTPEVEVGV